MNDILNKLHEVAASPRAQMDGYLAQGKKIVLCAPVYTPEELIHAMGFVPMGAWGGDVALNRAKEYCPAFLCAIVQSLLELGINGAYEGRYRHPLPVRYPQDRGRELEVRRAVHPLHPHDLSPEPQARLRRGLYQGRL